MQLLQLPWQDVLFEHILPCLSPPDLLNLRQVSLAARHLTDEYCSSSMRILDAKRAFDLTGYRLNCSAFKILAGKSSSLRSLRFKSNHGWLVDDLLVPVIYANCHLRVVHLDQSHWLTDASIRALAVSCPQLTSLSLLDCHWLSNNALALIGSTWPDLGELNLACCWQIDDAGLKQLLIGCQRLQKLSVAKCYGLTDESLLALRDNPCLAELDLVGCWRVTDVVLEQLSEFCRALRRLSIRECSGISLAAIERLQRKRIATDLKPPSSYRLFANANQDVYVAPPLNVQI